MAVSSPRLPGSSLTRQSRPTRRPQFAGTAAPERSLEDFQRKPAVQLHPGRSQNGADGAGRTPLFSNYFAQIAGGNFQFENGDLLAFHQTDRNLFRDVY